jgi:hypothetical protein
MIYIFNSGTLKTMAGISHGPERKELESIDHAHCKVQIVCDKVIVNSFKPRPGSRRLPTSNKFIVLDMYCEHLYTYIAR